MHCHPFCSVTGKPSAPIIKNKESQVSGCDVCLRWSIPESNGCPLTKYRIYYTELQWSNEGDAWHKINVIADTRSLYLPSLKCNTEYVYAVTAWNEVGESDMSRVWSIKTIKGMN